MGHVSKGNLKDRAVLRDSAVIVVGNLLPEQGCAVSTLADRREITESHKRVFLAGSVYSVI
jgi:hypothetical protein